MKNAKVYSVTSGEDDLGVYPQGVIIDGVAYKLEGVPPMIPPGPKWIKLEDTDNWNK